MKFSLLVGLLICASIGPAQAQSRSPRAGSAQVVALLHRRDMKAVARFVDPGWGLRFSPEVDVQNSDVHLSREQVARLNEDKLAHVWGTYDGEGGPIRLGWPAYWKRFVWNRNFARGARIGTNTSVLRSTTPANLRTFYPGSTAIEYYLPPTSKDKSDWSSLWLVWRKRAQTWRLIGIAHGEWTS